ncbi:MAG: permease prefix domain 1-containing protein, partial [Longimicrobiales bacterium]
MRSDRRGLLVRLERWLRRARYLRQRGAAEREMDEEFRAHVELQTEENLRRGLSPAEARRRAALAFGGVERFKEEAREARGTRWLEDFVVDLRLAARAFAKRPGFTGAVVLTLALGIGANTALFSVIDAILLESLPFHQPERLVRIWPEGALPSGGIVLARERSRSYEQLAGYSFASPASLTGRGEPECIEVSRVTANLFSTLGVTAEEGRTLLPG